MPEKEDIFAVGTFYNATPFFFSSSQSCYVALPGLSVMTVFRQQPLQAVGVDLSKMSWHRPKKNHQRPEIRAIHLWTCWRTAWCYRSCTTPRDDATKSANWANRIKILLGELHVKTSLVSNKKVAKAFRSTEQNRSGDAEYWNDSQLTWDSSMAQDYQSKRHGFIRFQILKMIRVRSKQIPILTNTHLDPKWFGWITILVLSIPHCYSYINSLNPNSWQLNLYFES